MTVILEEFHRCKEAENRNAYFTLHFGEMALWTMEDGPILGNINYCPFCGTKLEAQKEKEN